jgi:hypothetical protein
MNPTTPTRRTFLRHSALAGAGLFLSPGLRAQGSNDDSDFTTRLRGTTSRGEIAAAALRCGHDASPNPTPQSFAGKAGPARRRRDSTTLRIARPRSQVQRTRPFVSYLPAMPNGAA